MSLLGKVLNIAILSRNITASTAESEMKASLLPIKHESRTAKIEDPDPFHVSRSLPFD